MTEFVIPKPTLDGQILNKINTASADRSRLVEVLVEQSQLLTKKINRKYPKILKLNLYDTTQNPHVDVSGWVLQINQLFIKPEWGYTKDDPYFSYVGRVEISELMVNDGKPKLLIQEWRENGVVKVGPSVSLPIEPIQVVHYLKSIHETGNARLSRT